MANKVIQILINAKDDASAVFLNLKNTVAAVGGALAAYFGASAFVDVVRGASDFEQAMSRVKAATGASAEEMVALQKAAEDAGATSKFSSVEAAGALENLAKAGLSAKDAIATLPAVLNLATAADVDLAQSSELLSKAVMGMGLAFTEAGRVADVLALGANATNTSVLGLAQALSYTAPIANSLGLSLEATVAIIGKFADAGIDAGRAGTALNSILSQFADPASKFRSELGAAGITTSNFEKALHELAAAGPGGAKAIIAVGQEAGPALRALLNQGMGALDDLTAKLKNAEGSAAATAAVMKNNLNSSLQSLASAWQYVKDTLGTPVLPVLKQGVDELAAAFRGAVADGTIQRFGESIATAFTQAIKFTRDFLASFNFAEATARLQSFADETNAKLTVVAQYASNAANAFQIAWGVMTAGSSAVVAAIMTVGAVFADHLAKIQAGIAALYELSSKVTFGNISKQYAEIAAEIRLSSEATAAAAQAMRDKAKQSLQDVADSAESARAGFAGLASGAGESVPVIDASARAAASLAKELENGAAAAAKAGAAYQKKVNDEQLAKQSADEHRAAIKQLQAEYSALVASGSIQEAAKKLQEINRVLGETPAKAKEAAEAVAGAFRNLGMKTSEELNEMAAKTAGAFDTLKKNGVTSATALREAFAAYANAAMEAAERQGEAAVRTTRSLLESKAAATGLKLEVTDAGNVIVRSMRDAEAATRGAGNAARGAAGGYREMGQSAEQAAAQIKKLKEIYERNKVGDGSDKIGKSGDVREAAVMETDINQDIVKRYGADMVDSDLTRKAWQLRQQLESYQRNYGAGRSQQSLEQQRNIAAELERIEALIEAQRVAAEREKAASRSAMAGTSATPRASGSSSGTGSSRAGSGGGIGAGQTPVNMTINLNGRPTQVNTDADGAVALQGLLGALSNGKGTSR